MAETTTQEIRVLQVPSTVKRLVEALIFAAKEPLTVKQIKAIYEQQGGENEDRTIDAEEIRAILADLNEEFQRDDKPYRIVAIAGGFQFATLSQYAEWLGKLYKEQARRKLSQSSTETLAIVAYKQPISRPEIESIRGVNCDYVLATLLEKDLVTIVGRAPTPGRPLLYGTTKEFLKHFGLNEITDLPRPREIEEILGESQFETERRMLEAQAGAAEMKKEDEDFKSRLPHIPKRRPELDGEVKIVQRNKQKEIRKPDADESATDKSIQERIEFPQEITGPQNEPADTSDNVLEERRQDSTDGEAYPVRSALPQPDESAHNGVESQVNDKDQVPRELMPLELTSPPVSEAQTIDPLGGIQEEPVETKSDKQEGSVKPAEAIPALSNQEEILQPPSIQPEHKSAWHNWKEKIQSFIRKLFG
ncbi:MAG: SMC-Scp complex subunit ScpB [Ignavibacteriales bacterium]|nr:SMC-Scp complex subunit ScpB [Ignavibacteriales bacterium]